MATGASQIFIEQLREGLEILGIGGAPAKAFLSARMDDQSTSLTTADHIEFDQQLEVDGSGDIALSVGAGQLGGLITLAPAKTYLLVAAMMCDFSGTGGVVRVRFRNNTLAAEFGAQGEAIPVSGGNQARAAWFHGIVTTGAAPEIVEARITGVFQFTSFRGAGPVGNTQLIVLEVG